MQRYKVITLPLAENDIIRNVDYIYLNKQSPDTALKLKQGFKDTISSLDTFPEGHELDEDPDLAKIKIRKCYYKNYKIFFYVDKENMTVSILRVLHMLVDAKPLLLDI